MSTKPIPKGSKYGAVNGNMIEAAIKAVPSKIEPTLPPAPQIAGIMRISIVASNGVDN